MKPKKVIIILIIIAVVIGGIGYVATKASDLKLPSHSDFVRHMHGGGNE
jgi:Flp pilus assembly protein CpaB